MKADEVDTRVSCPYCKDELVHGRDLIEGCCRECRMEIREKKIRPPKNGRSSVRRIRHKQFR